MNTLLSIEELKTATGYKSASDIQKCLHKNGIRVIYGKKGYLFTTLDAVNKALGIGDAGQQTDIELL